MLLNWSLIMLPLVLVLGKKLRLKRLVLFAEADSDEAEVELLLVPWRSGSCIRPWSCLVENKGPCCWDWRSWNAWFGSVMKNDEWGGDCTPNADEWCRFGEIKCSNFGALPRLNKLLAEGAWFWSWAPSPRLMWFVPYRWWVPKGFRFEGCLALSCARASQKALWVIKLSRLQQVNNILLELKNTNVVYIHITSTRKTIQTKFLQVYNLDSWPILLQVYYRLKG